MVLGNWNRETEIGKPELGVRKRRLENRNKVSGNRDRKSGKQLPGNRYQKLGIGKRRSEIGLRIFTETICEFHWF